MKSKKRYYLAILSFILFTFLGCSNRQKEILQNEEFRIIRQMAMDRNQNFCIVLSDTINSTSKIYQERLESSKIGTIFNIIDIKLSKNNWYKQWLYSNSDPITCIFTPSGKLIDIIPGASRKCFKCIEQTVKTGVTCHNLAYYNNFSIEKEQIIQLLNEILQCKLDVERGVNIESRINRLSNSINYPYIAYLKMMNSINQNKHETAQLSAHQLLAFNNDLELEIYPELFTYAKGVINPDYDSKIEPILECETLIHLDKCKKGVARPFEIKVFNLGKTPLKIQDIQLDCSCVSLTDDKAYTINPQESQRINFEFTASKNEETMREIILKSNGIQPIKIINIITTSLSSKRKEVL